MLLLFSLSILFLCSVTLSLNFLALIMSVIICFPFSSYFPFFVSFVAFFLCSITLSLIFPAIITLFISFSSSMFFPFPCFPSSLPTLSCSYRPSPPFLYLQNVMPWWLRIHVIRLLVFYSSLSLFPSFTISFPPFFMLSSFSPAFHALQNVTARVRNSCYPIIYFILLLYMFLFLHPSHIALLLPFFPFTSLPFPSSLRAE